jgi:hypothetical protein
VTTANPISLESGSRQLWLIEDTCSSSRVTASSRVGGGTVGGWMGWISMSVATDGEEGEGTLGSQKLVLCKVYRV